MGAGNGHRSADLDETEEAWSHVLVHAKATSGGGVVFHPAGMKSVGRFELTPIWHRRSLETPAGGLVAKVTTFHLVSTNGIPVGVGAITMSLAIDTKISRWSRVSGTSHCHRHDQERFAAFHDIGHLIAERNFHPDF